MQTPNVLVVNGEVRIALNPQWMTMTMPQAEVLREQLAGIERCVWIQQEDGWWKACEDNAFEFTNDGPVENKIKFCPYCGRKIKNKRFKYE